MTRRKNRRLYENKLSKKFGSVKYKEEFKGASKFFPRSLKKFISTYRKSVVKTADVTNPSKSVKTMPVSEKIVNWLVGTKIGKWTIYKIAERIIENEDSRAKIVHLGMNALNEKIFGKTSV
jgi:hypothetical protein